MSDPIADNGFVSLACGLAVAFFAARRYDTPETNRLSTTQSLFLLSGAGYVIASLAMFSILSEIVLKPGILSFLGLDDAQKVVAKFSTPPVLAAVILTTLLPNVAVLSAGDAWLLRRFQSWGRIPQGVRNLADSMTQSALVVDLPDLQAWMTSEGDVPNELVARVSAASTETSRGSLTQVLRLFQQLEKLEALPAYKKSFRMRQNAWQTMREDFRVFTAQSQAFFVLFDRLTQVDGAGADALNQARNRYSDICQKLYGQLAEFLAQSLLISEGTELRIEYQLQSLGFYIQESTSPPLPVGPFVFMGVAMIVAILAITAVIRPPNSGPLPLAISALLIGATKTIGVLAAGLPKLRWAWFRPGADGELPYLGWLASAAAAAIVALVFERLALIVAYHAAAAAFDFEKYPLTPLAPTTFAIGVAVAMLCDVDLHIGQGWIRRVTEGLLCGAAMVTSLVICLYSTIPSLTAGQTSAWFPYAFSFVIGFVSGFIAPHLYRRAGGEAPQTQEPALRTA